MDTTRNLDGWFDEYAYTVADHRAMVPLTTGSAQAWHRACYASSRLGAALRDALPRLSMLRTLHARCPNGRSASRVDAYARFVVRIKAAHDVAYRAVDANQERA